MLKQVLSFFTLLIALSVFGQVSIGKESNNLSALLDFGSDNTKGIVLPSIDNANVRAFPGTILMNSTSGSIVYFNNSSSAEVLTGFDGNGQGLPQDPLFSNLTEDIPSSGVQILGQNTASYPFYFPVSFLLASDDKALVLPHVDSPETTMGSPKPGTICYDTSSNTIAMFDGDRWYFWKRNTNN